MSGKPTGYTTSMRIPPELYADLLALMEEKNVTLGSLIQLVLNRFVQNAGYPGLRDAKAKRYSALLGNRTKDYYEMKKAEALKAVQAFKKVHVSIWVQAEVWEPVKNIADRYGDPLSTTICLILEDYVDKVKSGEIASIGDPVPVMPGRLCVRSSNLPPLTLGPAPDPAPAPPVPEPPRPVALTPQEVAAMWGVTLSPA